MAEVDPHLELVLTAVSNGRPQKMRALGTSMSPAIPDGTWLELVSANPHQGALGDVVAVRATDGRFLIHRIRGMSADGRLLLMGDNCPKPDGWFSPSEVVARVQRMDAGNGWESLSAPRSASGRLEGNKVRRALRRALRAAWGQLRARA